jgi:hypothetical protein
MPIDPLYSDSPLLQGSKTDGCPKTSTDVSFISELGYPVVTDISDRKICTSELFKTGEGDQYLYSTEGCCVLDSSALNCYDIANVDATEENNYYMGLRYLSVTDPSKGERKICYTTPIRKKKVNILDLLTNVLKDIVILIVMVLVAACYEYWIVYGGCETGGIQTSLYDLPYKVGNHEKKPQISKSSNSERVDCPNNTENTSNGTGLEWYDTFPYNLISFLNNNEGYNGSEKDTSKIFDLLELIKIPARSLLLGFFYCIIFSRIAMKGFIGTVNHIGSSLNIYPKDPNKYSQFFSGLIFIVVFMGIYGTLTDKFIATKQPFLNASSLFLLAIIIVFTVWIPSLLSLFVMMLTFVGYRRGTYEKYKDEILNPPEKTNAKMTAESLSERLYSLFDWYRVIVVLLFNLKATITGKDGKDEDNDKLYNKDAKNNLNINNENDLDWFFPIRRSKLELSLRNPWIEEKFKGLYHYNFLKYGCTKNRIPNSSTEGISLAKYYWWLHYYMFDPIQLIDFYTPLEVDCEEFEKVTALKLSLRDWGGRILFALIATFIIPPLRFCFFWIIIICLVFLLVLLVLCVILLTCTVIGIATYSIFIALLGNIIALFYLHFYVIIGFFYVPFKHYPELLKIIKSHGIILTLLFCMIVVLAGVKVLHPTSVGVIGGILGLLVLYKIITLLSV